MSALLRFFGWLSARAPLLAVRDADRELDKLAFIRIATGLVVLARVLPITVGSQFYFYDRLVGPLPAATVFGVVMVALLLCVTVGLFTPLTLALVMLLVGPFDDVAQTATLGTTVLALHLPLLLLTGAGSRMSADAALMRGDGRLARAVRWSYVVPGRLDADALRVCYFLSFTAYAVISFGAILLHAHDSYWRAGQTLQVMLTSSYLSSFYAAFRALEVSAPAVLYGISIVGSAGQAVFQVFMIPLMFTRTGGWFVALWGLGFFLASAALLQLSYLPYVELLLWAAVFVRAPARRVVAIYYDDYCNLCKRTMQVLRAADVIGTFDFRPASRHADDAARYGIADLSVALHGVYRERVYVGYDLYLLVARRAPLLWVLAPVLWFLRLVRVGPAVYSAVARNRRRMFGTCELPYDANLRSRTRHAVQPSRWLAPALGVACTVFVALWCGTLFLRFPDIDTGRAPPEEGIRRLGFDVPNVFNALDLQLGDAWPVVHREAANGSWELVPLIGLDGQKLLYPRLVDVLYFGNGLRWRRRALEVDTLARFASPHGRGGFLVQRAIAFDDRLRGGRGGRYRVDVYENDASDPRQRGAAKYVPRLVTSYLVYRRRYE